MRFNRILPVFALPLVFQLTGCVSNNEELLSAIGKLETRLENIEKKLDKQDKASMEYSIAGAEMTKASLEKLNKIKFPKNPDKESLRKYVAEIMSATKGQRSFAPMDPQVEMLAKVGEENIDVLMECLKFSNFRVPTYHITQAIADIATDKSKDKIIAMLPKNQDLIRVIVNNGWEYDARETMIKILKSHPQYMDYEFLKALVSLNDKNTYEDLRNHFIYGSNQSTTYNLIKKLPIPNLDKALIDAWEIAMRNSDHSSQWNKTNMALLALEAGQKNAYAVLFDNIDSKELRYTRPQMIAALRRHSDCSGSVENLREWYNKNKDNLVFDPQGKRFKVKAAEKDRE
ncbi:MAG: hypothetical protein JXR78_15105 [Victivallales bacterium]|nr:hypothetical protein [Victivallales bacterium]